MRLRLLKKAIVFEGEKSCLLYKSYFGIDNDISVALVVQLICLSNSTLGRAGAEEIIVAFDRQFQEIGDKFQFQHLKSNLLFET